MCISYFNIVLDVLNGGGGGGGGMHQWTLPANNVNEFF